MSEFTPEVSGVRLGLDSWMPSAVEQRHIVEMGWQLGGPHPMPEHVVDTEPPPARVVPLRHGRRWLVTVTRGQSQREFAIFAPKPPKISDLTILLQPLFPQPLSLFYTLEVREAPGEVQWSDGSVGKVLEDKAPARETRK